MVIISIQALLWLFQVVKEVASAEFGGNVFLGNIPSNETEINITACSGHKAHHNIFVDHHMTWFQAMDACITLGFNTVDPVVKSWNRHINIRNYLEDINYNNLNYTFWHGAFRPYLHVRKWYKNWGVCEEYPYEVTNRDLNGGQCAIFRRNETDEHVETVLTENCYKMHPFVCVKFLGYVDFIAYEGFSVTDRPLMAFVKKRVNISFNNCKTECYADPWCNAFTYFNDSQNCTLIKRTSVTILRYTIEQSTLNSTHYAKKGCVVGFIPNTVNISVRNKTAEMPDCGVDEIPPGYCPCEVTVKEINVTNIQEIVDERIKNLTVDRKSTSAYQRSLNSSPDDRNVSKAFGALGIILIIGMLSLVVLSDILLRETKKTGTMKEAKNVKVENHGVEMQKVESRDCSTQNQTE